MNPRHRDWLRELTSLPSVAGHEDRVVAWVQRWAARHAEGLAAVQLHADRFGNLILQGRGARSSRPIIFTAHMDHPGFVVTKVHSPRRLTARFHGGVADPYFTRAKVLLHGQDGRAPGCTRGRIASIKPKGPADVGQTVEVALAKAAEAAPGQLLTWDVGPQRLRGDRLHTPACDDLAGVAAALSALDELLKAPVIDGSPARGGRRCQASAGGAPAPRMLDVRVLLTRAEEVAFIGAIAACKAGTIPTGARLIALEASRSFADSPIGAGPIVRVGDRVCSFDPDLTYRVGQIAEALARRDRTFRFQRKLMPGGVCEASAYQAYGYTATCLCLPLGNYHNMNPTTGRIAAEVISLADYRGLVRLLTQIAVALDDAEQAPSFKSRLEQLFAQRRWVLGA